MSILMNLKYPISTPPTTKQLEELPPDVFKNWILDIGYKSGGKVPSFNSSTPHQVSSAFVAFYEKNAMNEKVTEQLNKLVQKLRDRIYTLDE